MKNTLIAGLLALASIVAFAQPAAAETRDGRFTEAVRTADLDLTHEAGAAVLEQRIRTTVRRACNKPTHPYELRQWSAYRACERTALEHTIARIDAPLVLARFDDVRREGRFQTASAN